MSKPTKAFDLSKLTSTNEGTYMGRTIEVWKELGMGPTVTKAIGGDKYAIAKCYAAIAKDKQLKKTIKLYAK